MNFKACRLLASRVPPTPIKCSGCRAFLEDLVECHKCHRLQPPPAAPTPITFFHLASPLAPIRFEVDQGELKRRFLDVQKRCHPDKTTTGCDRVVAEAWSAWANRAYGVLKDPLRRAKYLYNLTCRRHDGTDLQGAGDVEGADDAGLGGMTEHELLGVLEGRERVAEAGGPGEVELIRADNEAVMQADFRALASAFSRHDCATARHLINRLNYWLNLRDACDDRIKDFT